MTLDAGIIQSPATVPPLLPALEPPSVWVAFGLIGLYLALQAAFSGVLLGVVTLLQRLGRAKDVATGQAHYAVADVLQQPGVMTAVTIISVYVAALLIVVVLRQQWPRLWAYAAPPGFGVTRPTRAHWFAAALLIGALLPLLGGALTQWLAHGHEVSQDIQQLARQAPLGWQIALAMMAISLGPLVEELLFRGMLLSALIPRCRLPLAALLSAASFAAIHLPGLQWQWYALPQLILLGVALVWLRVRYQSLWPAVLAHGTHNALALSVWFFALNTVS